MRKTIKLVAEEIMKPWRIWIKLSPYANPVERERIARYIIEARRHVLIERVTLTNTFPNCVARDEKGKILITAKNTGGRAGMAGTGLRPIALANAEHFRMLLPPEIGINGAGGISTGEDLAAYYRIGCAGAQIGSAFFWNENFRIFEQVASKFLDQIESS